MEQVGAAGVSMAACGRAGSCGLHTGCDGWLCAVGAAGRAASSAAGICRAPRAFVLQVAVWFLTAPSVLRPIAPPPTLQPPPSKPTNKLTLTDRAHAALGKSLVESPEGPKVGGSCVGVCVCVCVGGGGGGGGGGAAAASLGLLGERIRFCSPPRRGRFSGARPGQRQPAQGGVQETPRRGYSRVRAAARTLRMCPLSLLRHPTQGVAYYNKGFTFVNLGVLAYLGDDRALTQVRPGL